MLISRKYKGKHWEALTFKSEAGWEQYRRVVTYSKFLLIDGRFQNQETVVSVKTDVVRPLEISEMDLQSHDLH